MWCGKCFVKWNVSDALDLVVDADDFCKSFFFINNVRILLIIKIAKPSTLGMYYGGTNQETKEQRSRKVEKEEQEKWEKTTLQSKRVCKKKDLISSKERSQPSKLLAFLSRQMHQIKQIYYFVGEIGLGNILWIYGIWCWHAWGG